MTLSGAVAGRSDPEGRRHDAGAPDGGGRSPPVPCLGRALSRQDGPVPGRGVEPRQVDGPDRGLQAWRACSCRPRRRSSTRPAPRSSDPGSRSSRSGPRAPSVPTRRRPNRGVEKFFGAMPSWELYPEPSNVDVVIVPAIDGNFDPSSVELIPFERQFQTFHSLQNYFLLNELLAPGFADADRRHGPASRRRGSTSSGGSPNGRTLHPGGHAAGAPRRDGSGALGPGDASLRVRATDPSRRRCRPAGRARPRGARRWPAGRT